MLVFLFSLSGCTYTVNNFADIPDANPGDFKCEIVVEGGGPNIIAAPNVGRCTLRAAIMEANATIWKDTIKVPAGQYSLTLPTDVGGGVLRITEDVQIHGAGPGLTLVDGNNRSQIFKIGGEESSPEVSIAGVTIQNGRGGIGLPGGGIFVFEGTLFLSDCKVENNETDYPGGGIANGGQLHILHCTIQNNRVPIGKGPTDENVGGGIQHSAGGVMNYVSGHLIIENSTINGNVSNRGGGIRNAGGRLRVQNSTISGNTARFQGGGIMNHGPAEIVFSTIVNNRARLKITSTPDEEEGGGGIINTGEITMRSSILTQNQDLEDQAEFLEHFSPDCRSRDGGVITSKGQNVIGILTTNCNLNLHAIDVAGTQDHPLPEQVHPLAQNGGKTPTHLLKSDSHGIDQAVSPPCPATDQRGFTRPADGDNNGVAECDSGSLESGAQPPDLPISGR